MGFERFGIVSFTTETKAADFITYLEKGQIMASRCKKCGRVYFPPRTDCADDFTSEMEWIPVEGKGKLITYTVVSYGPTGFENDTPYILALAEFPSGVRIFGRLDKELPQEEIKVGMEVVPSPVELPEGKIAYQLKKA
jgi:uncharacterized OB-fold protein